MLAWLLVEQARLGATDARSSDLPTAAAGVVGALALVGAALWLERACRVPPQRRRHEPDRVDGAPWASGGADRRPPG